MGVLKQGNAKPSQIKRVLLDKFKKKVSVQKIKNTIAQMFPDDSHGQGDQLVKYLDQTVEEGGIVEYLNNEDGDMKAMFFTSGKMMSAFRFQNTNVIQMDTSFEIENARYKLAAMCYLDTASDKTEIAAYALMSDETAESFEFVLKEFSKICVRQNLVFLVDKDFTQLKILHKVFPSARVLLCIFHTLKSMKALFTTIVERVETKAVVMSQFKEVLYSNTLESLQTNNDKFLALTQDLNVRVTRKV